MEKINYSCVNGAHHTGMCCPTCWNGHPEAMPDAMFRGSIEWKEVVKRDWIDEATSVGFTYEQTEFLYKLR